MKNSEKTCKTCNEIYDIADFVKSDGRKMPSCRKCRTDFITKNPPKNKACKTCNEKFNLSEFAKEDGKQYLSCKKCRNEYIQNEKLKINFE